MPYATSHHRVRKRAAGRPRTFRAPGRVTPDRRARPTTTSGTSFRSRPTSRSASPRFARSDRAVRSHSLATRSSAEFRAGRSTRVPHEIKRAGSTTRAESRSPCSPESGQTSPARSGALLIEESTCSPMDAVAFPRRRPSRSPRAGRSFGAPRRRGRWTACSLRIHRRPPRDSVSRRGSAIDRRALRDRPYASAFGPALITPCWSTRGRSPVPKAGFPCRPTRRRSSRSATPAKRSAPGRNRLRGATPSAKRCRRDPAPLPIPGSARSGTWTSPILSAPNLPATLFRRCRPRQRRQKRPRARRGGRPSGPGPGPDGLAHAAVLQRIAPQASITR